MAGNLINKYLWIIDAFERYGRLTREQLNELWVKSPVSDGVPMPRRSFYNYRDAIEDTFNISIQCDKRTFEYYIDDGGTGNATQMQRWLLDSVSLSGMLNDAQEIAHRIVFENVPSSREHLPVIVDAMKQNARIRFNYKSHMRIYPTEGVVIEPYFVKIFKQLWYVVGFNVKDNRIKTYSLDRMTHLVITDQHFEMPPDIDPERFFNDCFGITTNHDKPKDIILRVNPTQAKYFRALPLHHSQLEEIHDAYSIFHYRMRLTYDLKEEILSHGNNVEVVAPPELKAIIVEELKTSLENYGIKLQTAQNQ